MKRKFNKFLNSLLGLETGAIVKGISKGMKDAEKRIEVVTTNALKAASVFLMIFVGLIFVLVGLGGYLEVAYTLQPGIGMVIVGGALILLGWFAKLMRPS